MQLAAIDLRILAAIWTAAADSQDAGLVGLELAAIELRILAANWTAAPGCSIGGIGACCHRYKDSAASDYDYFRIV